MKSSLVSKCYVSSFVCLSTKAIHLELVSDLTKDAFIVALRRFVSRRGKPASIYSDNGTTCVGANNELQSLGQFLNIEAISLSESITNFGFSWHFIPHFGGLSETEVKSTKYHLKRVAGNSVLTYEEFYTFSGNRSIAKSQTFNSNVY